MKIFKFGGASVKDVKGVKNIVKVLEQVGYNDILIVLSAMGKMTNAFEKITDDYFYKKESLASSVEEVRTYHYQISAALFKDENHEIFSEIEKIFIQLTSFMIQNKIRDFNFVYDQIVSLAELISTKIVSHYLNEVGIENTWIDVRDCIKTNDEYREAIVNWKETEKAITTKIQPQNLYITQGFIARNSKGNTTTLGREGSDYSASIFANSLNADSLTIWKDVKGVLNADPRYFSATQLLQQISYTEAIELAFYGASVIHPKTLQPLQTKEIPLYVKSFVNPKNEGTTVTRGVNLIPEIPCFIVKKNQILLSISSLDFSFIVEQNISEIFELLHNFDMKVSLIQNSAISFSVCMDDKYNQFESLYDALISKFKIDYYKGVSLYTIRHFNSKTVKEIENNSKILLKQSTKETIQMVVQ